ncbi:cysteine--tRNA ligase [Halolactibacillus alkaliphilus]|uniref:Cysteine--tRNA ligase n=1 Tax=Halolactibacillus alkaliphilus TaxID=442899 RepID=A0A511X1X9_9BACI|nr:cysteine--tRNA ligase [Halolactibacillus alkaliphilus]GEN56952.1 cysteine--tRNA ligase [Halolactibacillus alkaliphilus]GGN70670.1 cysteine--tRNA ligase [Halolactibacillus alkaliphilus]SFO83997.1 cysteinyl-tRNA synthetase [Halolactibacillus alkaliphilus]
MTIRMYNTLTRQKEVFKPIEENKVRMYVCGPTVYNYIHIGNARPAIVFDTVRRYLGYRGYDVTYVLNFTDVDDKIIRAAQEEGIDLKKLSDKYIAAYREDVARLGVKEATVYPRVTESMTEIITFINTLIDKKFAYQSDGDVYFRARKFKEYGKLSHQSLDDLQSGARVEVDGRKEDPIDFALWKKAKPNEMYWESPWGQGRPGWHIECSAMAKEHLGETIDIHAGGQDLTFPHHENEIAQSEACNGHTFSNYWLHNGYINIDNEKMSKSIGNTVLARDLLDQYSGLLLRFFMLSVHYRSPINFSHDLIKQSEQGLKRIENVVKSLNERLIDAEEGPETVRGDIDVLIERFETAMDDDFNTANAIAVIFDAVKVVNTYLGKQVVLLSDLEAYTVMFKRFFEVLGLEIEAEEELLDVEIDQLLVEREEARKNRDFNRADEIRDQLKAENIILEDTANGTRWRRG